MKGCAEAKPQEQIRRQAARLQDSEGSSPARLPQGPGEEWPEKVPERQVGAHVKSSKSHIRNVSATLQSMGSHWRFLSGHRS